MISPIGSFLVSFDTNIQTAMNAGITGLTAYMAKPVMTSIAIYYVIQGVRVVQGDGGPVQEFVTRLVRNVTILWFCSNADTYNKWVMNIFFTGIPTALNNAIMANSATGVTTMVPNGVNGTAAQFDQIWALVSQMVASVQAHADWMDISTKLGAFFCYVSAGGLLVVIVAVYMMSRFILAVVLELGVAAIACLIFDATKPIFERWLGKVIALVFLQVTAIVVLQIVLTADVEYLKQIQAANLAVDGPAELQGLIGIVVMLLMGAFGIYSLPAVAYSIGTGVAINTNLPLLLAAVAAKMAVGGGAGGGGMPSLELAEASEELSLGLPSGELTGSRMAAIGAPPAAALPPPPLSLAGE